MIVDHIRNRHLYASLGSGIAAALEYCADALEKYNASGEFAEGDAEIGGGVIMKTHPVTTRPAENCTYEAHYRYLDIHFVVYGGERIGYADTKKLTVTEDMPEKDLVLLEGEGDFLTVMPGYFVITYPDDAHAPAVCLNRPGEVYGKIVAKIPVNA